MDLKKIKITYNAPVVLTFCIFATLIFFLSKLVFNDNLINAFFIVRGRGSESIPDAFDFTNPVDYVRLVFHVFGHTDFSHLSGNLCFLLLLGPILEQKYGSLKLFIMMLITSVVSGFINAIFLPNPMCGASDIIFMMILLISYTSLNKNEIPLSFILIFILYIGKCFMITDSNSSIATIAHIAGGICGSLFAFIFAPDSKTVKISEFSNKKTAKNSKPKEKTKVQQKKVTKQDNSDDDATVVGSLEF